MIVVADAGPVRYLVVIGAVDVLQSLYGRVLVPEAVAGELQDANTPASVLVWIAQPPRGVRSTRTRPPTRPWVFSMPVSMQPSRSPSPSTPSVC